MEISSILVSALWLFLNGCTLFQLAGKKRYFLHKKLLCKSQHFSSIPWTSCTCCKTFLSLFSYVFTRPLNAYQVTFFFPFIWLLFRLTTKKADLCNFLLLLKLLILFYYQLSIFKYTIYQNFYIDFFNQALTQGLYLTFITFLCVAFHVVQ